MCSNQSAAQQHTHENGNIVLWLILFIVGLGFGFSLARVSHVTVASSSASSGSVATASTAAADFRTNLVAAAVSRNYLIDMALPAMVNQSPSASAQQLALQANATQMIRLLSPFYTAAQQTQLNGYLTVMVQDLSSYTSADQSATPKAKSAALSAIYSGATIPLANLLANPEKTLPAETLSASINTYVEGLATVLDDHVQAAYSAEQTDLATANSQTTALFSSIAAALVAQYPKQFLGT